MVVVMNFQLLLSCTMFLVSSETIKNTFQILVNWNSNADKLECRRKLLMEHFDEVVHESDYEQSCKYCDNCEHTSTCYHR